MTTIAITITHEIMKRELDEAKARAARIKEQTQSAPIVDIARHMELRAEYLAAIGLSGLMANLLRINREGGRVADHIHTHPRTRSQTHQGTGGWISHYHVNEGETIELEDLLAATLDHEVNGDRVLGERVKSAMRTAQYRMAEGKIGDAIESIIEARAHEIKVANLKRIDAEIATGQLRLS